MNIASKQTNILQTHLQELNTQQQQQPLEQQNTPQPTYLDSEGNKYDLWSNGWEHKLPMDTTNTLRLFTKKFNSISPQLDFLLFCFRDP